MSALTVLVYVGAPLIPWIAVKRFAMMLSRVLGIISPS
jgi:hypothetical protein